MSTADEYRCGPAGMIARINFRTYWLEMTDGIVVEDKIKNIGGLDWNNYYSIVLKNEGTG